MIPGICRDFVEKTCDKCLRRVANNENNRRGVYKSYVFQLSVQRKPVTMTTEPYLWVMRLTYFQHYIISTIWRCYFQTQVLTGLRRMKYPTRKSLAFYIFNASPSNSKNDLSAFRKIHFTWRARSLVRKSLHFAWVVDDAKCIVVTRVCVSVCVSVCPRPHAHTTARTRMYLGVGDVP